MDSQIWFVILLLVTGVRHAHCNAPGYSTALESELRTLLFTNYEILQRPSQTVNVGIVFNLLTINSLDIKSQTLTTTGYFTMTWTDGALLWNNRVNYSNINFLFSSEEYMWRPAIVIENSVSDLEVFSDEDTLIRVASNGVASWSPGGVFSTYCEVDTSYYPLDTQQCDIILSTWAYTSGEVVLAFENPAFILDNFRINGEWDLLETSTSTETTSRESQSYSRLYYTIKVRRRSLFHILNTLFPVILMATLVVFAFKLPPESGERIGMTLTVLLTYAVYLTLIADTIPQTSLHTSVLSVYLTIILILCTLSVIFSTYVLRIHFKRTDEPVPKLLQVFTRKVLTKIVCYKENRSICRHEKVAHDDHLTSSDVKLEAIENKGSQEPEVTFTENAPDTNARDKRSEFTWKEIARIIDKCLMRLFAILIFLCTFICCLILIVHYNST